MTNRYNTVVTPVPVQIPHEVDLKYCKELVALFGMELREQKAIEDKMMAEIFPKEATE